MTYVSWACFYEGVTDHLYYNVLVPRLMEAIILADGIRHSDIPQTPAAIIGCRDRRLESVASEICNNSDAFHVMFVHADVGGPSSARDLSQRSLAYCERANTICSWVLDRCVSITPRRETEAWVLADPQAVCTALGFTGNPVDIGLPPVSREIERIPDPKATLADAVRRVSGRRRRGARVDQIFPAVAQRQRIDALRELPSFREFEEQLRTSLRSLGCLA